jgi:carboxylate-amine ligase
VIGPEHEFSIVDETLRPLPITDKIIKDYCGKIINFVELPNFSFGKELQLHVMEIKANEPFKSPALFEETMHEAVLTLSEFIGKRYRAQLLGTGMHPLMHLNDTKVWPHRHRKIYQEYNKLFNLNQHGWLNIQSFHLNLPYLKDANGVLIHNYLVNLCPYLPAISASSPIYEGSFGKNVDNRLAFYKINQKEVPSITGEVVPDYISSLKMYKDNVIGRYSNELAQAGASKTILFKEWMNSRGVIFRFDRSALEVRIMDEQECVKSDVALSCFVRSALRGLIAEKAELLPHSLLVSDFNSVLATGLKAQVKHPAGQTARHICKHLYQIAWANAQSEEKKYLPLIQKRIENGNLSELICRDVSKKAQRTDLMEAIALVYSKLIKCLKSNQPYS